MRPGPSSSPRIQTTSWEPRRWSSRARDRVAHFFGEPRSAARGRRFGTNEGRRAFLELRIGHRMDPHRGKMDAPSPFEDARWGKMDGHRPFEDPHREKMEAHRP